MSNRSHTSDSDLVHSALRDGLHALPVPPVSSDFDARVLAGLTRPLPWWLLAWHTARPVLSAAACSLAITLVVLQWARASSPPPPKAAQTATAARADKIDLLEAIDHPNIHAAYLPTLLPHTRSRPDPNDPLDTSRTVSPVRTRVARSGLQWTPRSS
jgi:hypothetical protein